MKVIFIALFYILISIKTAHAYIEPGIISMFLQGIVAAVVGVSTFVVLYWSKFKTLIKKILSKFKKKYDSK